MPRAHPSVPISSSRTDARDLRESQARGARDPREQSPPPRSRKHPRNQSGDTIDPALEDEDDEDDERYGESSRFRQNGMGNGGVYSFDNSYYMPEASYTPHLIPMFQHNQYRADNPRNDDHLEDASALLSMAYPGGVPEPAPPTVAGQLVVPDWASGQTQSIQESEASTSASSTTLPAAPTLAESVAFPGMSWNGQDVGIGSSNGVSNGPLASGNLEGWVSD
jgi:hypothetical protein